MSCDSRGLPEAPAYALFQWSDACGGWFALARCRRRERVKLEKLYGLFDQLRTLADDHSYFVLAGVSSVEADVVAEIARAMRPPARARFVDPAPDGVFEPERVEH